MGPKVVCLLTWIARAKLNPTWPGGAGRNQVLYSAHCMPAYGSHNTAGLADDFAADKNEFRPPDPRGQDKRSA